MVAHAQLQRQIAEIFYKDGASQLMKDGIYSSLSQGVIDGLERSLLEDSVNGLAPDLVAEDNSLALMSGNEGDLLENSLIPPDLSDNIVYSLAQISLPGHSEVLGTAWLADYDGSFSVVMPYHIGGKKGSERLVRVYDSYGRTKEILIHVMANGNAGFHSPDLSIAPLPESFLKGNYPLSVGSIDENLPIFSFGYVTGLAKPTDWLAMRRQIRAMEGLGIMGDRNVPGESPNNIVKLSGYCGSPWVQMTEDGGIKVVAVHEGSVINSAEDLTQNVTFAIDASKSMQLVFDSMKKSPEKTTRRLMFRGFYIDSLLFSERVRTVRVARGEKIIFQRELRNFAAPYSDVHSELAVNGLTLEKGDKILYEIQGENRQQIRNVEYIIP